MPMERNSSLVNGQRVIASSERECGLEFVFKSFSNLLRKGKLESLQLFDFEARLTFLDVSLNVF